MANRKDSEALLGKKGGNIKSTLSDEKRAVCYIEIGNDCGTGFYVEVRGTKYIATCYHVIHNVQEAKEAVFRFLYVDDCTKDSCKVTFDEVTSDDFITGGKEVTENDFTFIRCSDSMVKKLEEELKISPIPTSTEIPDNLKNLDVKVVQHPNGEPLSESKQKIVNVVDNTVTYYADTLPGSSGSPVFLAKSMKLLALHFKGNREGNDGILISSIIKKLENKSTHVVMLRCSVPKTGNSELVLTDLFSNSSFLQDTGNQIHAGDVGQLSYPKKDVDVHYANAGAKTSLVKDVAKDKGLTSPTDNGFTIDILRRKDIDHLESMLDQDHGANIKNWRHLGEEIFKDNKEVFSRVNNLDSHYSGGGNPSLAFFKSLSTKRPKITVQEFIDAAKSFDRNDVVEEIYGIDKGMEFRHLPEKHKDAIASMLNKRVAGVKDWRMFADYFGYLQNQIESMQSSIKEPNSYSPTAKLFALLKQTKPLMPLQELVEICEKFHRNDVAIYLKGVIKEQEMK